MPKKLTERGIVAAKPPAKGTKTLWDASLNRFGLRISQGGTKSFIVLIESGRRQTIGRFPQISLAEARSAAKILLAEQVLGRLRPSHKAFDDAKEEFLADCAAKNRPQTIYSYTRLLKIHYPFGRKALSDVSPRDVVKRMNAIRGKPSEKHHAYVAGKVFFNWCATQHYIDRSPMERVATPPLPRPRERVLTPDELVRVYQAAMSGATPYHRIVALLILTGQRRGEIAGLQWDWIKDDHIKFPSTVTKNKRPHTIPLLGNARSIIESCPVFDDSPYLFPAARSMNPRTTVFNGWSKAKAQFDQESEVYGWTLHDLRRTFATGLAQLGVTQTVTEKLLNHVSGGSQSPIAQVYNRHQYQAEMKGALQQWESCLAGECVSTEQFELAQ